MNEEWSQCGLRFLKQARNKGRHDKALRVGKAVGQGKAVEHGFGVEVTTKTKRGISRSGMEMKRGKCGGRLCCASVHAVSDLAFLELAEVDVLAVAVRDLGVVEVDEVGMLEARAVGAARPFPSSAPHAPLQSPLPSLHQSRA